MFKKTVSMHEVFLQRLAAHPVLRSDSNFRIFLEYKDDVKRNFFQKKCLFFIHLVKCSWKKCYRKN